MSRPSLGRFGLLLLSLIGLMAIYSASASAAGAPIVTVGAPTNKTLNTATLNGTVNPNGESTSYKFEYGKSKLYGKSTTAVAIGSGTSAVAVNKVLTGLEPLTTYHVRVSATNSSGTTVSEDMLFEMLLDWKIEGKHASELANPYVNEAGFEWPITIEKEALKKPVKITCKGTPWEGGPKLAILSVEYNLPFKSCKAYFNGVEQKACAPTDLTLHMNAFAHTTEAFAGWKLSEECAFGDTVNLAGGYSVPSLSPEQKEQVFSITGVSDEGWSLTYGPVHWTARGESIGKVFGVS